jgi:hypothetical protein
LQLVTFTAAHKYASDQTSPRRFGAEQALRIGVGRPARVLFGSVKTPLRANDVPKLRLGGKLLERKFENLVNATLRHARSS